MEETAAFGSFLRGKTVVVSGGTSGIGLSVAEGFAKACATVIGTGSSEERLQVANESAGRSSVRFERLDVRDADAVTRFFAALDRLHVLVNCQGIARPDLE